MKGSKKKSTTLYFIPFCLEIKVRTGTTMVPAFLPRCLDCRRVFFAPFLDCLETKHLEKKEGKFRARRIYQRVEVVESVLM